VGAAPQSAHGPQGHMADEIEAAATGLMTRIDEMD
jgi:hypothetical protein